MVAPVESTARYKYVHFPATRRYVSSHHDAFGLPQFRTTAAVQFRCVPLHPASDRDVIHAEVALRHDLFEVSQAQAEPEIPPDAQDDDLRFEMSSLEQCWPFL